MTRVGATATLQLLMVRFENPHERDYGGSCCDVACNDCDHIFRFALDRGNRSTLLDFVTLRWHSATGTELATRVRKSLLERCRFTTFYFTHLGLCSLSYTERYNLIPAKRFDMIKILQNRFPF